MKEKSLIKDTEFTFIDVETTGLSPHGGDRVIEIAAMKVKNSKVVKKFETFVDPQRELSYGAFLVNGISDEMLKGAPKAHEILPEFMDMVQNSIIVGLKVFYKQLSD